MEGGFRVKMFTVFNLLAAVPNILFGTCVGTQRGGDLRPRPQGGSGGGALSGGDRGAWQ